MSASGLVVEDVFRKLSKRCAQAQLVMDMRRAHERRIDKTKGLHSDVCNLTQRGLKSMHSDGNWELQSLHFGRD